MLQKSNILVTFSNGLDTKTDPKLVPQGLLLTCENGVFNKGGTITKRTGFTQLGNETGTVSISKLNSVAVFGNELLTLGSSSVYSYSTALDSWISKGKTAALKVSAQPIARNTANQTNCVQSTNNDITMIAYADDRGGIRISVKDEESDLLYLVDQQITVSGTTPKVVAVGNYLYCLYLDGSNMLHKRVNIHDPTTISSEVRLRSDVHASGVYNALEISDVRVLIAYSNTDPNIAWFYMSNNGTEVANPFRHTGSAGTELPEGSIALVPMENINKVIIGWTQFSGSLRGASAKFIDLDTLISPDSGDNMMSYTGTVMPRIIGAPETDYRARFWFETLGDHVAASYSAEQHQIHTGFYEIATSLDTGNGGASSKVLEGVGLGSDAWQHSGTTFFMVARETREQPTYFIFAVDPDSTTTGSVVGKIAPLNAGGIPRSKILPSVVDASSGSFTVPYLVQQSVVRDGIDSGSVSLRATRGINRATITHDDRTSFQSVVFGNNLIIGGPVVQCYDRQGLFEAGFHFYPENVSASVLNGTQHLSGVYDYRVLYAQQDAQGQLHRSAPSDFIEFTLTGTAGVTLTIPTLKITNRHKNGRGPVKCEIYRSLSRASGSSVFYKVGEVDNNPAIETVSYNDTTPDATLEGNQPLYTDSTELENDGLPGASIVAVHDNRLFFVSDEEPNRVYFSKPQAINLGTEFSALQYFEIDPAGGSITALASMDASLVIFKRDNIFYVQGPGPDIFGDGSFTQVLLLTTDVGCISRNSIVATPLGLMFQSAKGIYLLPRNLGQVQYIGAAVESFNDLEITSAQLLDDQNNVIFFSEEGTALVYNYFFNAWSTFSDLEAVGAGIWKNLLIYASPDGNVYQQNQDVYTDDSLHYAMTIGTAWINLNAIQQYKRIYEAVFLGDWKSYHDLRIKIYYNYDIYPRTVKYFSGSFDRDDYGDDPYGTGSYGGDAPYVHQWRLKLGQQCQAIRFELEDVPDVVSGSGESFTLSALNLQIGLKPQLAKLGSTKTVR